MQMKQLNSLAVSALTACALAAGSLLSPQTACATTTPTLYGSILNSDSNFGRGICTIPTSSYGSLSMEISGVTATYAVIKDGKYYAYYTNGYDYPTVKVYNLLSHQQVGETWTGSSYSDFNFGMDMDPVSGELYGAFYDEAGYDVELAKFRFDGSQIVRTQTIGTLNSGSAWYGIAFDQSGQLYGISAEPYSYAYLYKINKETAAMTSVGSTGVEPLDNTSICFDRENEKLYWSVYTEGNYYQEEGYLATVNLTNGRVTKVYNYPGAEYISGIAIDNEVTPQGVPGQCTAVTANFAGGALTGYVSLTAPSILADGTNGTGALTISVKLNDTVLPVVTASWGEQLQIPVVAPESGMYTITVSATNDAGEGNAVAINRFIGQDAPQACQTVALSYTDGTMSLTWSEVTQSLHGGWMDIDNLKYKVTRFPDNMVVAQDLTDTSFSESVAMPEYKTEYYYEVVAYYGENESAPKQSNSIKLASAIAAPYEFDLTTEFDDFTVIDANNDSKKWQLNGDEAKISYNTDLAMNDWLITPPIKLTAGKYYRVSFYSRSQSNMYTERLEVKYGNAATADAMTGVLLEPTDIESTTRRNFDGYIHATEDEQIFIGFHGISEADRYALYVGEIVIDELDFPTPYDVYGMRDGDMINLTWNRPTFTFGHPVKEEHLAGYRVYLNGVSVNDSYIQTESHSVPVSNLDLSQPNLFHVTAVYHDEAGRTAESDASDLFSFVSTGVTDVNLTLRITALNGSIRIVGAEGMEVSIYDASGRTIYAAKGTADMNVCVARGVYVVKICNKNYKVII